MRGLPLPTADETASSARTASALDLLLAIADCRRTCDRDWTDTVIAAAVDIGNSTTSLPGGDTIHGVARRLGLPYATTWRHVRSLAAGGRLVENAGCYARTPSTRLCDSQVIASTTIAGRTRALLARLAAAERVSARRVA